MNSAPEVSAKSTPPCCGCLFIGVRDIFSWKNVLATGSALALIDASFLLLWGFNISFITFAAALGVLAMCLGFVVSTIV